VLLSLLPGLRDLRTPLAVGYLWLAAAWLIWGDEVPKEDDATGLARSAYQFVGVLGVAGSLTALTFVAYVLGAVLCLQYLRSGAGLPWPRKPPDPGTALHGNLIRRLGMGFVSEGTAEVLAEHIHKRRAHSTHDGPTLARIAGLPRREHPPQVVEGGIYLQLRGELQELVTKLGLLEKDRLWEEYDRKSAEAEFRVPVAVPLAAVIAVAAVIDSGWIAVGLVFPAVFLVQGLRRGQEARSEVFLAVVQDVIHSYVLDRVGPVPDEDRVTAPAEQTPTGLTPVPSARPPSEGEELPDVGGAAPGERHAGAAVPVAADHRAALDRPPVEPHGGPPRP
jgi:hypothetical protein